MKLEFAFFDFTNGGRSENAYRGLGECALNFSTTYDYAVKLDEEKRTYMITRAKKPKNNQIPKDFWGKNIYNISALVGDNGSGKSTILYNLIRCLLKARDNDHEVELRPSVPFCIIYLDESDQPHSYCDKSSKFSGLDFVGNIEYPGCFQKLKCMLIDNTLSLSSRDFDMLVCECCHDISKVYNPDFDALEHKKQLFNKSLSASIRSNCYFSLMKVDGNMAHSSLVEHYLDMHMKYESYQELRFILKWDRYEMLKDLSAEGYPVPLPNNVFIYIDDLSDNLMALLPSVDKNTRTLLTTLSQKGPIGLLVANIALRMYVGSKRSFNSFANAVIGLYSEDTSLQSILKILDKHMADMDLHHTPHYELLDLIIKNEDYFDTQNEHLALSSTVIINLQSIFNDAYRYKIFADFLDRYRSIVGGEYFLTFGFGLSSGEKNILKMLTQFDYIMEGKRFQGDSERGEDKIVNMLPCRGELECDTLFLFFDEADLTYHPEWQRRFVSILSAVIPKVFGAEANKRLVSDIQVFLATHSPLMLSDFPDASSIYLKHGKDGLVRCENSGSMSNFAQNLYFILRDGFFLNDTIGEFAKKKINEVAAWCNEVVEKDGEPRKKYFEIKEKYDDAEADWRKKQKQLKESEVSPESDKTKNADSEFALYRDKAYANKEYTDAEKRLENAQDELIKEAHRYMLYLRAVREKLAAYGTDAEHHEVEVEYYKVNDVFKELWRGRKSKEQCFDEWPCSEHDYNSVFSEFSSYFSDRASEIEQKREIVRLLPEGLIKGKLISDIERTEDVFLRYGICSKEKLKERQEWLEKELERIKNMKGVLD